MDESVEQMKNKREDRWVGKGEKILPERNAPSRADRIAGKAPSSFPPGCSGSYSCYVCVLGNHANCTTVDIIKSED
jgi:hypothetical protein